MRFNNNCPVCGNDSLEEGDYVDIGVGYQKCSPDHCEICGFIEASHVNDKSIEEYKKEYQKIKSFVYPNNYIGVNDKRRDLKEKYKNWIENNVPKVPEETRGRCLEFCKLMINAFPELRLVHGKYYEVPLMERNHFWLLDEEDFILDPTSNQFPGINANYYHAEKLMDERMLYA